MPPSDLELAQLKAKGGLELPLLRLQISDNFVPTRFFNEFDRLLMVSVATMLIFVYVEIWVRKPSRILLSHIPVHPIASLPELCSSSTND